MNSTEANDSRLNHACKVLLNEFAANPQENSPAAMDRFVITINLGGDHVERFDKSISISADDVAPNDGSAAPLRPVTIANKRWDGDDVVATPAAKTPVKTIAHEPVGVEKTLKTTAVRDGDDWIINGSKTFITNGFNADLVIVAARTSPEKKAKGITLFVIETGMDGFTRGRKLDKVGQPESDTAELFFDTVRVPDANRLGEVDRGFIAMMERLPQERIGAAISNLAHASAILDETLQYAKERKAFGQQIGSFQYNKFLFAELVTKIEVTQAFVDQGIVAHAAGELSAVDAAKAKWWSAQVQNDVLDACVQLHGGYGYMRRGGGASRLQVERLHARQQPHLSEPGAGVLVAGVLREGLLVGAIARA